MNLDLVDRACGSRHGMVAAPAIVPPTAADPIGVVHASVPRDDEPTKSSGGGAARSATAATTAAVAEALERYAAMHSTVPITLASSLTAHDRRIRLDECALHSSDQQSDPSFPHRAAYPDDEWLAETFDLRTNAPTWVPAALVSLTDDYGALATSSGLAAAPFVVTALLRAVQELVERDAYVATWLHQLGGREVSMPDIAAELAILGGEARVFDLTPRFSPHPVALVTGTRYLAGRPQHSLGIACRSTWSEAVDKAFVECCQGLVFVGHTLATNPGLDTMRPDQVTGFDEHAIYYGLNPHRWNDLPLLAHAVPAPPPADSPASTGSHTEQLRELIGSLTSAGVRLCYRELTTVDCRQVGLRVVRVVAPDLTPLHHDHRWPYLGGRTSDAAWRYDEIEARNGGRSFPSPHPHALG